MVEEEEEKQLGPILIGEDLSQLSIDELKKRIEKLREEIARIEETISGKQDSKVNAETFFKI